ncbi:MAG: cytochrome c biogenesis protein CcsA [Bacteroidaceae bacterium]|nr:cytochrome c biogenesis protein CcsA [Bacteroidaceae bacterium]
MIPSVQSFEFPWSLLLAVSFLLAAGLLHRLARGTKTVMALRSALTSRILLGIGAVLLAVEGTFSVSIHCSAFFAAYVLLLLLSLALVILDTAAKHGRLGGILSHLGFFIILWAAFFGAPDVRRCRMMIRQSETTSIAYTDKSVLVPLPFSIRLDRFDTDYYDTAPQSPKQFRSVLSVDGERMVTAVNSPCDIDGYTVFQDGYDSLGGDYSILLLVRDPWLPVVFFGMAVLAAGAVLLLFGKWNLKVTLPLTAVLTVSFTLLSVYRINFLTLMPALRSWWFLPHLCLYMIAYSLMAVAVAIGLAGTFRLRLPDSLAHGIENGLMRSSSALLVLGMLTGSVWARQAWGDYWTWDPKENWAAVTWLVSLIHIHIPRHHHRWRLAILLLAFLALQVTWYGVNYLPSASDSLHTYGTSYQIPSN